MFPTVPEDLSTLSIAELRSLVRELRTYSREQLAAARAADVTPEDRQAAIANSERALFVAKTLNDEIDVQKAQAADDATEAAEAAEAAAAQAAADEAAAAQASDTGGGDDDDADGDDDDAGVGDGTDDAAATTPVPTGVATGAAATGGSVTTLRDRILAQDGVKGLNAGDPFGDMGALAVALHDRANSISPTTDTKHYVAEIEGQYPAERKLTTDPMHNMRVLGNLGWDANTPEVKAAVCAPLTPMYGLACESSLFRPVAASLNSLEAPRGGVITMSSPSISDFTNAGIWTHEDDDAMDPEDPDTWKPCDVIECGTPEQFLMYAVFWCLRIKNWTALTYPELVAAALNRGLASRARLAERQLLDAMGAGVPVINAQELGYGSTVTITTQILNYLTLRREYERWGDEQMDGWAHRWVLDAMRIDLARRNRSGAWDLASRAEVNARLAEAGVDMTWYWDSPSWGTPAPDLTTAGNPSAGFLGTLSPLPDEADFLLAPKGKFRMIDRAQLQIGVTGNNLYRDNRSLAMNEFTFFVENYEGVVDTNSCPAHLLHFQGLCHTGRQIADQLIECDGGAAASLAAAAA